MPRLSRSASEQDAAAAHSPEYLEGLARALRIVTAFGAERPQMTLSEVATAADLSRASARRALFTLESLGYVASDGRLFRLTPQVLALASAYLSSNGVSTAAQPIVEGVCRDIGETCSVAVMDRDEVVFVARASPRRIISVDLAIGYRLPAYATSVGRVLLGGMDPTRLDAYLVRIDAVKLTPRTIVDKHVLKAAIITGREQGYCIVDEEAELGLRSVAVPARRYDGALTCAIQVGVRAERVSMGKVHDDILPALRRAAEDLGRLLI